MEAIVIIFPLTVYAQHNNEWIKTTTRLFSLRSPNKTQCAACNKTPHLKMENRFFKMKKKLRCTFGWEIKERVSRNRRSMTGETDHQRTKKLEGGDGNQLPSGKRR
jgi:hypothetical protein